MNFVVGALSLLLFEAFILWLAFRFRLLYFESAGSEYVLELDDDFECECQKNQDK